MKFLTALVGALGITGVQIAGSIDPSDLPKLGQSIIQVIIALVTLWGLLKKKKPQ